MATMRYYEVYVSSQSYHGNEPLTYSSEESLDVGNIVMVPLRNKPTLAIVVRKTIKPKFETKNIISQPISKPLPKQSLDLLNWLIDYYPSPLGVATGLFLPPSFLKKEKTPDKLAVSGYEQKPEPELTTDQANVLRSIRSNPDQRSWLLHGGTGTGKTRVYTELIQSAIKQKRSALVLTPEIGLASPLAHNIKKAVKCPVIVLHSGLTEAQRRDAWLQVLYCTQPLVVVGPRSALFAPFNDLGLIVVDESHDTSYKQEQAPHYQALRVASHLAQSYEAQIVYGSATPSIAEYYYASQKGVPVLQMNQLAAGNSQHENKVITVDQRDRSNFTNHQLVSDQLISEIASCLKRGEQSLLFLNRRGTARLIVCQSCGWQALCPRCDLPLTYHSDNHRMQCHTCGYHQQIITSCPVCNQTNIIYKSAGTKALATSIQKLFPQAVIARFDTDNSRENDLEAMYRRINEGKIQILIGTQMLIKGHDFPKLSLVGVLSADTSLNFPDYTAEEQTYQLLTQVMGRVGRGHRNGTVVIQTFNRDSPVINYSLNKNWNEFYKQQINERSRFGFPPFCFTLKLTCRRKTNLSAEKAAKILASNLVKDYPETVLLGPAPSFIAKTNGWYSWQIIIKSKQRARLISIIKRLPANWHFDIDPSNLL